MVKPFFLALDCLIKDVPGIAAVPDLPAVAEAFRLVTPNIADADGQAIDGRLYRGERCQTCSQQGVLVPDVQKVTLRKSCLFKGLSHGPCRNPLK